MLAWYMSTICRNPTESRLCFYHYDDLRSKHLEANFRKKPAVKSMSCTEVQNMYIFWFDWQILLWCNLSNPIIQLSYWMVIWSYGRLLCSIPGYNLFVLAFAWKYKIYDLFNSLIGYYTCCLNLIWITKQFYRQNYQSVNVEICFQARRLKHTRFVFPHKDICHLFVIWVTKIITF